MPTMANCKVKKKSKLRHAEYYDFQSIQDMPAEKFIAAFLRSEYIIPKKLVFKADNLYAKVMSDSSLKEVISHD